jgi:hypothetical protein
MFAIPTADPLPLPSPPWLLWALLMLTFLLHLIPMNIVLGGSIISAVSRFRQNDDARRLAAWFGKLMPSAVAATITFGVAPLLFVQALYGRLFFSSSVLMARFWFAVVPILIVAYYGTYLISFRGEKVGKVLTPIVALLFASVAFIYCNDMSFMLRPQTFLGRYLADARGVQLNVTDPTFVPRLLHMLLGAIAVAGFVVVIYGAVKRRSDVRHGEWALRHGALWLAGATALNVATGMWWLLALPRDVILRLTPAWLAAGIVFSVITFALILAAPHRRVVWSGLALLATLVTMIFARDDLRRAMLDTAGFHLVTRTAPQWDVIALFAVLLVAALGISGTMVVGLLRARPAPS